MFDMIQGLNKLERDKLTEIAKTVALQASPSTSNRSHELSPLRFNLDSSDPISFDSANNSMEENGGKDTQRLLK
jgi:hypothetical protein